MRTMGVSSRFLAGALAAWFSLVMAAPAILHSCPMVMATAAAAAESHAQHGAHHSDHQSPDVPTSCQCLGSCAVSAPAIPAAGSTALGVVPGPVASADLLDPSKAAPVLKVDHTQPFATAPPLHLG